MLDVVIQDGIACIVKGSVASLCEHRIENHLGAGKACIGQNQRFRLAFGVINQTFLEQPVGDLPIEAFPDAPAVMKGQAEDRERPRRRSAKTA